jgi:hypothetical protein
MGEGGRIPLDDIKIIANQRRLIADGVVAVDDFRLGFMVGGVVVVKFSRSIVAGFALPFRGSIDGGLR